MYPSAYELKSFYNTDFGKVIQKSVYRQIKKMWPNVNNLRLMGYGYPVPYMDYYLNESERSFAIMPASRGVHKWPEHDANLVSMARGYQLPIETESIDRILLIHAVEYAYSIDELLEEIWRVLKSNGRMIVVVPNRIGFWSRATWSPFGQGVPYSHYQINKTLQKSRFVCENYSRALYTPPLNWALNIKSADFFERYGKYIYPALSGLHIIEASKQVYSGLLKPELQTNRIKKRVIVANAITERKDIL